MMTNHQESAQAGLDAEQVLQNPAYKFAIERMRTEIYEAWKACPIRDQEGQMLLLQRCKLAEQFENILNGLIQTGKMAQNQLNVDRMRNETLIESAKRKFYR